MDVSHCEINLMDPSWDAIVTPIREVRMRDKKGLSYGGQIALRIQQSVQHLSQIHAPLPALSSALVVLLTSISAVRLLAQPQHRNLSLPLAQPAGLARAVGYKRPRPDRDE